MDCKTQELMVECVEPALTLGSQIINSRWLRKTVVLMEEAQSNLLQGGMSPDIAGAVVAAVAAAETNLTPAFLRFDMQLQKTKRWEWTVAVPKQCWREDYRCRPRSLSQE